jgi:biopolymer transport protein ExbD
MKRMARNRAAAARLNLTPLMDVFTTLVFFLVVNQGTTELLDAPKQITLPDSVVEDKPRETVVIFVSPEHITVQGEVVARVADVEALEGDIAAVAARLAKLSGSVIGVNTKTVAESEEVTILADKAVPFHIVKKVLSTCTAEGYERISLAVTQKEVETSRTARS